MTSDCGKSGDFRSITSHFRRRRTPNVSYQSDRPQASIEQFQNFRQQVYNKQEVDTKMHIVENKIQEMEGLVHSMEHSMKKMKRHVSKKKMECSEFYESCARHKNNASLVLFVCKTLFLNKLYSLAISKSNSLNFHNEFISLKYRRKQMSYNVVLFYFSVSFRFMWF